jgi:AraC family transcriptional regulator
VCVKGSTDPCSQPESIRRNTSEGQRAAKMYYLHETARSIINQPLGRSSFATVDMQQRVRESTLGDKVRELSLSGVSLTEVQFSPSRQLPWHEHACARLCLVLQGNCVEQLRSGQHMLRPFDLTFKPAGAVHRDRYCSIDGAQSLIVDFDQAWVDSLGENGTIIDGPLFFSSGAFAHVGQKLYGEFKSPDNLSGLAIETACVDLLIQASRRARAPRRAREPAWLLRIRDMLESDHGERYTLQQLALVADVHPVHLAQTFRRVYSSTIGEYIRSLRVRRAADELARTDRPIAMIAISYGFYDQSHLNRVFKKHMKLTPAQYRARSRGRRN